MEYKVPPPLSVYFFCNCMFRLKKLSAVWIKSKICGILLNYTLINTEHHTTKVYLPRRRSTLKQTNIWNKVVSLMHIYWMSGNNLWVSALMQTLSEQLHSFLHRSSESKFTFWRLGTFHGKWSHCKKWI